MKGREMKTYAKKNGSKIVVDGNVAYVDNPKGRAFLGTSDGLRRSYTFDHLNLVPAVAQKTGCKRGISICLNGSCAGYCTLAAEDEAWLDANWPVTATTDERWLELRPADAKAMMDYNLQMAAWQSEFNRRMEDEGLSSIGLPCPNAEKPTLTKEGKAWLNLEHMRWAHNCAKSGAAERAIKRVVDGEASLVDAAKQVKAEWGKHCDEHAWD